MAGIYLPHMTHPRVLEIGTNLGLSNVEMQSNCSSEVGKLDDWMVDLPLDHDV